MYNFLNKIIDAAETVYNSLFGCFTAINACVNQEAPQSHSHGNFPLIGQYDYLEDDHGIHFSIGKYSAHID